VEWDERRQIVKVNPIVAWSDEDVAAYISANGVIVNPLRFRGYESIGCFPCTAAGSGREGRWAGSEKTECGLHVAEPSITHPPIAAPGESPAGQVPAVPAGGGPAGS